MLSLRFVICLVPAVLVISQRATATAVVVNAASDGRDAVWSLLYELPLAQHHFDPTTNILKLRGPIELHFTTIRPNIAPGFMITIARRLSGYGAVGGMRIDVADADVRLIGDDLAWRLERVGGSGGRRSQQELVRLDHQPWHSMGHVRDHIMNTFRLVRNLSKGGRTYRLGKSILFDLRSLPLEWQVEVTTLLRTCLAAGELNGRPISADHATVHVLRDDVFTSEGALVLVAPPPIRSTIEFVRNPRFKTSDHLTYFTRVLPSGHFRVEGSTLRLRGYIDLRDDALPVGERRALRLAVAEVREGRQKISGLTIDASAAAVEFIGDIGGAPASCDGTIRGGGR